MTHNQLIRVARDAWLAGCSFRSKRDRYKRYTYGDQWCDSVPDATGRMRKEEDLLYLAGKQPYSNNLIRHLVKTIVGRYRLMASERHYYSTSPRSVDRQCQLSELDARLLEEFLISGMAVQRVEVQGSGATRRVTVENVDPRRFFVNQIRDPRGYDVEFIGQCRDMSMPELLSRFGHGDLDRIARLHNIYQNRRHCESYAGYTELGQADDIEFFQAAPGKCRVIELWTLDADQRLMCSDPLSGKLYYRLMSEAADILHTNDMRRASGTPPIEAVADIDFRWNCRWLAPTGELLDSCPSTQPNGRHPYVMRLYPLTDGEIHPFVEDIIDQQRLINRLIMMIDKMMASSAKGVLLFPLNQLPDDISLADVCRTWAQADGVIPITGRGSDLPQQVVTSTHDVGAYQLLELQMRLFDNISGVGGVLQGRSISGNAGADAYDRQIESATIALSDLLETFGALVAERSAYLAQ